MVFSVVVTPEDFAYLRIQKGNLDNLAGNFDRWHAEYQRDLEHQFRSIELHLPITCQNVLDVGSGLGGIDIMIRRHYEERGQSPTVCLLDGENDPPTMRLHRETFNNMAVAREFHYRNGTAAKKFRYWTPRSIFPGPGVALDLVVSFGSWCFHYPPQTYLPALCRSGFHAGTVAIMDVRKNKLNWWRELTADLEPVAKVAEKSKWERWVFRVKR